MTPTSRDHACGIETPLSPDSSPSSTPSQAGQPASRHTPGPWQVLKPFQTALTKRLSVISPAGDAELGNWMVAAQIPHLADARLIAAAPRLLEALKALQDHCADQGWWLKSHAVKVMDEARAAIAAAEGEE